jgi:transcriptional regulator with XRE-family HTH domain
MSPRQLGQAIKRLRTKQRLTQAQLAERAGVSQPYLSQLEAGQKREPAVRIIHRIAKVLGVKIEDLL